MILDTDNQINMVTHSTFAHIVNADKIYTPSDLYKILYGVEAQEMKLEASGGDRVYSRLYSPYGPTVIGTAGSDIVENRAFVMLADVFRNHGIKVPQVLIADKDFHSYLQEDLGEESLLSLLSTEKRIELSKAALKELVALQTIDEKEWLPYVYASPFSKRMVMWDLNYFKYEFVKPCGAIFDEDRFEDDFERLSDKMSCYEPALWGFMYRDFQSRNILIKEEKPYFIDFQGGRKGPTLYDAVSFLWQAKAGFSKEERSVLLETYATAYSFARNIPKEKVLENVEQMALLRTLQVLGAYGFRGLVEKRSHFIESIPGALINLKELLEKGVLNPYPELKNVCRQLTESHYASQAKPAGLTVKIFSFSYKKGYPEDLSGNGGGFMFDCRGMHNPGRYDKYKPLTGLDRDVIDFLEERGEVQEFLQNAYRLVSPSVARYIERGFSSLQIGFGCTGGRHRSVYCAQHLAERLAEEFPGTRVELVHREQGITQIIKTDKTVNELCRQ